MRAARRPDPAPSEDELRRAIEEIDRRIAALQEEAERIRRVLRAAEENRRRSSR